MGVVPEMAMLLSQNRTISMPDSAEALARLALQRLSAICTFVPDRAAILSASAEKMSTNIIDIISAKPRRLGSADFCADFILPHSKTPIRRIGSYFCVTI